MENTSLKNKKIYLAFFDLDRTIIEINSGRVLVRQAYEQKLMSKNDFNRALYLSILFKLHLKDPLKIINDMMSWLKGTTESSFTEFADSVFNKHLKASIFKRAEEEIAFHRTNGGEVVLLSSALLPVCKNVASYLKIENIICSNLEVSNGVYTGKPTGPVCYGKEKELRLRAYCIERAMNPDDAWYYGDSISDIYVLSAVGNPVCINPDKKLKKEAIKRNWPVFQWND